MNEKEAAATVPGDGDPPPFDWLIFADATFAGLSVLIPLPLVDSLFEGIFRRRMPWSIARRRRVPLPPMLHRALGRAEGCSPGGCLLQTGQQLFNLLKKLSRKILYFLTIKEATDRLSYYWHRAFLIDHLLRQGYQANAVDEAQAARLRQALEQTLEAAGTSPLQQLAAQVVGNSHHVGRSLWRILRRQPEDEAIQAQRALLGRRWHEYDDYWRKLAQRFDTALAAS